MTLNNTTVIIPTQPDRPTLGYFANQEAAKCRLISDGGMWEICPVIKEVGDPQEEAKLARLCPHDDKTPCRTGQLCETCPIFWETKGGHLV